MKYLSIQKTNKVVANVKDKFIPVIFGDRIGLAIFLGALCFFPLYWRVGFLLNDNHAIANALVNLADGHFEVQRILYGNDSGLAPGMQVHNGKLYARNYGLVTFGLPFVWIFQTIDLVADLRIALAGLWSITLLGLAYQIGCIFDYYRVSVLGGSVLAWLLFILNLAFATPLQSSLIYLIALQTSTMVAAALIGVFLYRILTYTHTKRQSALFSVIAVLGTPIGFWASIPKRHILVSLLALLTFYCFLRSQYNSHQELRFRTLSYGFIGLSAWVFPFEAIILLLVVGPVDLLTARSRQLRDLGVLLGVFVISLVPFFITNTVITGNPLQPPSTLPSYEAGQTAVAIPGTGSTGSAGAGPTESRSSTGFDGSQLSTLLDALVSQLAYISNRFYSFIATGGSILIEDPRRVYLTFIDSGYSERVADGGSPKKNLALLEVLPIAGTLLVLPAILIRSLKAKTAALKLKTPAAKLGVLLFAYTVMLTISYLPRLPTHATITVRYLLPIVIPLLYVVSQVEDDVSTRERGPGQYALCFGLVAGLLLVGEVALMVHTDFIGDSMQAHAQLALLAAGFAALSTVMTSSLDIEIPGLQMLRIVVPSALTTIFILLSGWVYFRGVGTFALPIARVLSELIVALS